MANSNGPAVNPIENSIASLVELSRLDTLYGDLYLSRARELLQDRMSPEVYHDLVRMESELIDLPNRIHNAVMQGKWQTVQELSVRMQSIKNNVERNQDLLNLVKPLYEHEEVLIDPFSPGMQTIAGTSANALPELRNRCLFHLQALMSGDAGWQRFYSERHRDVEAENVVVEGIPSAAENRPSASTLRQEAIEALEKGDFDKLQQLAGYMDKAEESLPGQEPVETECASDATVEKLDFSFSDSVIRRARTAGLVPVRVESRRWVCSSITPFIWRPTFGEFEGERGRELRLSSLPLAPDTPKALRERVEMFVLHPFINSAGIRFFPSLVDEDVLVEDFDEPAGESEMTGSPLLEALGLHRRNCLTRLQIEGALAEKGNVLVREELGLDPSVFRLVCIPPDVHLRIGMNRGWGGQAIWTHFDGYMLTADGKMHALAGGDVRFGGIYDMVGISRSYEAERIIVRFAVVQRRRMARPRV